jgi:transposase
MHQVREVLRLHLGLRLTLRQTARALGLSRSVVTDVAQRVRAQDLAWPLPADLTDDQLERLLYPAERRGRAPRPAPDFAAIRAELLKHKNLTLAAVWEEYKANHPDDGLQYSQFCQRYRNWERSLDLVLRQHHRAGEKLFIDYAGDKVPIHDPKTGAIHMASLFVCALGASKYTYAEATWAQDTRSFAYATVHALTFLGGVPEVLVPDNTKAAVIKASFYEPELNRTYLELAEHYGCVVIPARPLRPQDKAAVESAVQVAQRWILAVLRHHTFFSLEEANEAIHQCLERLNSRPFQKLEGSRQSLFESVDKPALRPLPERPYVVGIWKKARVHIDYHVQADHCYYSVPFTLVREEVDVRLTDTTVEVFHRGQRVAVHKRLYGKGKFTTDIAHCPESHRRHLTWSPSRLVSWAESVGPKTARLVEVILERHAHPEQGYRSCLGIMRLSKRYPAERVEMAAARALEIGARSYRSVKTILEKGLDGKPATPQDEQPALPLHKNVRGPDYYREGEGSTC